ncbi:MAG: ADOP family duplicated permease [Gemmatimonadaceae bacterium]
MPGWRFWKRREDDDFRDEIEAHIALEAERLMAHRGMSAKDARLAARRAFGNVTHAEEQFHDATRWVWLERWGQHLRHALRTMRRQPVFSLAAILTLALGIGFNTAIFSVFYAFGFRGLPVRDADRMVNVYHVLEGERRRPVSGFAAMMSWQDFEAHVNAIEAAGPDESRIESVAVYAPAELTLIADAASSVQGEYVSCGYFATLGVRLALGRGFVNDECARPGESAVAVISHDTWQRELGGDSAVVGRRVRINQTPFTVIGIAEPGFRGLTVLPSALWVPAPMQLVLDGSQLRDSLFLSDWSWMIMVARLGPGASPEDARAQLAVTARQRDRLFPGRDTRVVVTKAALLNFPEARSTGSIVAAALGVLGALVVVMICANLMNLLLARGLARRREIGIRLAIGASRRRLVEQLLVESGVLALIGGALGLALAYLLPWLLPRVLPVQLQVDLSPDARVLAFTALVSLVTAIVFGLIPAWRATRVDLVSAFKGGAIGGRQDVHPSRLRNTIVGVQVAGSALLLIVAALLVRAARHGSTIDTGYTTEGVVTFELNLPMLGYTPERASATYDMLVQRIAATPGVQSVALASPLPLLGRRSDVIRDADAPDRQFNPSLVAATASYFETLQIALVAGRVYSDAEVAAAGVTGEQPLVINQTLARLLSPDASPIGRRLTMADRMYRVVGVAMDTRATYLGATDVPFIYIPAHPGHDQDLYIVVRAAGSLAPIERLVPQITEGIDPSIVVKSQHLAERLALELMPARISSGIAGTMGALTLLLALIGIYGVVSYAVAQRTRDIAVRRALGATDRNVVRLIMGQGSRSVLIGLVVGASIAFAVSNVLRRLLLGVSPLDAISFGGAIGVLLVTAGLAIWVPARRAARVDPARILRED